MLIRNQTLLVWSLRAGHQVHGQVNPTQTYQSRAFLIKKRRFLSRVYWQDDRIYRMNHFVRMLLLTNVIILGLHKKYQFEKCTQNISIRNLQICLMIGLIGSHKILLSIVDMEINIIVTTSMI